MKRVLTIVILLSMITCLACGGGGGSGTGPAASLGPESGSNVLGAKYLAVGTAYAALKSIIFAGRAMFEDIGENFTESQIGQGDINGSISDMPYSVIWETEGLQGTLSVDYTYNLTQGSGPQSVIITYEQAVHTHNDIGYFGSLSFSVGDNSISGFYQYTNQLSSAISGNMTGAEEVIVTDPSSMPELASVSGSDSITMDMLLVALDPLDGTPYHTGAIYPDMSEATMTCTFADGKLKWEISNMSATVKYYLDPPNGVENVVELSPLTNESETYTCSNINVSLEFAVEDDSDETVTVGSDLHCTCPTCI